MTVGSDQTGKPMVSSANTTARLPTAPRTTWLDIATISAGLTLSISIHSLISGSIAAVQQIVNQIRGRLPGMPLS
jgi:hypothetical protein